MNGFNAAVVNRYAAGGEVVSLEQARAKRHFAERAHRLSARERSVIGEVARGSGTDEIAATLVLSPHTVRSHVKTAMRKLDARTRAHAVAIALSAGVVELSA